MAAGEGERGLALFTDLEQAHPDDPYLALSAARAALEMGEPLRAARSATRALQGAPVGDPEPALVLGMAWLSAHRPDDAARAFRTALERDPTNARARQGLANLRAVTQ
jgi:Flp pilus assembly protein TadD